MRTICPECNHAMIVKDEYEGKKGKCPKCSNMFTVAKATSPQTDETKPQDNRPIGSLEENKDRDTKQQPQNSQEAGTLGSKFDQKKFEDLLSGFHKVFSENGYFSAISTKASSLSRNTTYAVGLVS